MVVFGICPSVCVFLWADIIYVLVHVGCLFCVVAGSGGLIVVLVFVVFGLGWAGWFGGGWVVGWAPFLVLWVVLCVDILDA